MSVQGSMLSCLLFTTMFEHVLLLPLILIIFSKPPSAELCKHTQGCQLSLESHQTSPGSPTTITDISPVGVPPPTPHVRSRIRFGNVIFARSQVWWGLRALLSLASRNTYLQFLLRGEMWGTQSKCYCCCAVRVVVWLLYQLSNYSVYWL